MEVESSSSTGLVVSSAGTSGLIINIHPLAILNISDHHTRSRYLPSSASSSLFGALLGTQTGREVSIANSFELVFPDDDASRSKVDAEFFNTRKEQFNQVFPTQNVVGWYSIGSQPTAKDATIHKQMVELNDSATTVFVQFNPIIQEGAKQLPFAVYESALTEGATETDGEGKFVQLDCGIETGEAERIAVDGVTKDASGDADPSGQVASLTMQRNAISMLHERVIVLASYISGVIDGKATVDHGILRQIAALVATLPVMNAERFKSELETEYNDVQLTNYLTTLLQELEALSDYADKHSLVHEKKGEDMSSLGTQVGRPKRLGLVPNRRPRGERRP